MLEKTLAARVQNHEERLALLEALPARVSGMELQIRQLRTEMGEQFSAIRQEFALADSGLRGEIQALRTELRAEIATQCEAVRTDLRAEIKAEGEVVRRELRKEIREGDEETRRYMRVLHEEVLSRIATLQERRGPRRKRQT
jgi:hypothetical protein